MDREAFSNRACQEMLGCSEEDLRHVENWDKLVHPDDRASGAARYADQQQGKRERDEWQRRYIRRDGRTVVTEAMLTEEVLQANERTFRSIFENSQIAIRLYSGAGLVSDPSTLEVADGSRL